MPMQLQAILELLNLSKAEAEKGTESLDTLVKWTNEYIERNGLDWVKQNAASLRESWLYIQTM
jgi:hypothetical protein